LHTPRLSHWLPPHDLLRRDTLAGPLRFWKGPADPRRDGKRRQKHNAAESGPPDEATSSTARH